MGLPSWNTLSSTWCEPATKSLLQPADLREKLRASDGTPRLDAVADDPVQHALLRFVEVYVALVALPVVESCLLVLEPAV